MRAIQVTGLILWGSGASVMAPSELIVIVAEQLAPPQLAGIGTSSLVLPLAGIAGVFKVIAFGTLENVTLVTEGGASTVPLF